jgi:cytochrome c556
MGVAMDLREDSCMSRHSGAWIAIAAAGVLVTTAGAPAFAADEPANVIKYRQALMKANSAHITMIAAVVKGEVSWTDELAGHAHALHEQSKHLLRLFPEDTGKDDTDVKSAALPVIWEQWSKFEEAANAFEAESGKLVEAVESGDQAAIAQQLGALGKQGCGNCHETFREKQE